ncbi:MAG: IclR family transcriptional regulator [Clostridiaceae bacterium]|nr:IclR family transcriptional regulator [Clostridiaceae bacterium]
MEKKPYYLIQSVVRTLQIIEYLSQKGEVSVKEVAEYIGENKTTAHRFLSSIKHEGFLEQNSENKKYKLSLKLFEIGNKIVDTLDLRMIARPILNELSAHSLQTINLGVLNKGDIVYIDKAISGNNLRLDSPIGGRDSAHCTAMGKSILAFLSKGMQENYVNEYGLSMRTSNTITNPADFYKELDLIKQRGYARDREELALGIECVAAPIFDNFMYPIAAISISMPNNLENMRRMEEYREQIMVVSKKISSKLGAKI